MCAPLEEHTCEQRPLLDLSMVISSFHIFLCLSTVHGELWCWEKGDDLCVQVVWSEVDSMLKMIARLLILNDAPLAK